MRASCCASCGSARSIASSAASRARGGSARAAAPPLPTTWLMYASAALMAVTPQCRVSARASAGLPGAMYLWGRAHALKPAGHTGSSSSKCTCGAGPAR